MFNNTKTDIIERNTYVDEFEREAPQSVSTGVMQQTYVPTEEEIAFNSRIPENFDRILHYDTYNRQESIKQMNETYQMYSTNVNMDANPSSTTMQFVGMPKAEIYQDYKVETEYQTKTVVRPRAKLAMALLTLAICALSALVMFNTAVLKDLDAVIESKNSQIQELTEQKTALEDVLQDVSTRK
jgi:cell division protein FtsB